MSRRGSMLHSNNRKWSQVPSKTAYSRIEFPIVRPVHRLVGIRVRCQNLIQDECSPVTTIENTGILTSTAMGKSKVSRKSVSFQSSMDDTKDEASGDSSAHSTPIKSKPPFPSMNSKILATPIHSLLTIVGLFKLGLMENTTGVLLKSIPMVVLFSMVFGYILTQNVVPPSKKKANGTVSTKKKQSENVFLLLAGSAVVCLVMSVPIFVVVILFGAPLSSHITETFLLSIHLTFLVFYPLLVYFKMDTAKFSSLFDYDHIYRAIFTNQILSSSFFTIIGTWFGVFPIPLDWDRPWQQWPITLLTGAYVGSFFGGVLSIAVTAVLEDN